MNVLLDEFYRQDLHAPNFVERKTQLDELSYIIEGTAKSGKTHLIKHTLLQRKKSTYLYIDLSDIRIDTDEINAELGKFCREHEIETLALDNYRTDITLPNVPQLLLSSHEPLEIGNFEKIHLYPLDFEEFLAYEHKFDSTALNHFFQLGGYPAMHSVASEERHLYLQKTLQHALSPMEFDIMLLVAKFSAQKLSAFAIYERLKSTRKISKDMLYKSIEALKAKGYLHQLEKFEHARATKKLYLCDIAIKSALTTQKHFGRLFENVVYLEMLKHAEEIYYEENIDFYLPQKDAVILCMPFSNQDMLFKKIESIEGFLITHNVRRVTVVTMSSESTLHHPFVTVEMVPFALWALGE